MHTRSLIVVAVALNLLAAPASAAADQTPDVLRALGRLHPMLVHLPIGLILGAVFFEAVRLVRRRPEPSATAVSCLALGVAGAAAAIGAGLLYADQEPHGASGAMMLEWHRWLAIVSGVLALAALLAAPLVRSKSAVAARLFPWCLFLSAGTLAIAGHLGGSMVYGPDYLVEVLVPRSAAGGQESEAPRDRVAPAGAALTVSFARDVEPIFAAHCIQCHGPDKQKAGLRLDSYHVFDGPEDAWAVSPSDPEHSELFFRVSRPISDPERMPPEGPTLTPAQVESIRAWISEGAYLDAKTGASSGSSRGSSRGPSPALSSALTAQEEAESRAGVRSEAAVASEPAQEATGLTMAEAGAVRALRELGVRVEPIAAGEEWLDVNFRVAATPATDESLALLVPLASRVRTMTLAGSAVTDAGIAALPELPELRRLDLSSTRVGDEAARRIARLSSLATIVLVGTRVSDEGLNALAKSTSLRAIYLWQSQVTGHEAERVMRDRPELKVELGAF
jgi:uncharacterized membrane protein/mono/diheme cytochrome c family protein